MAGLGSAHLLGGTLETRASKEFAVLRLIEPSVFDILKSHRLVGEPELFFR
jgi:hypothetical protein